MGFIQSEILQDAEILVQQRKVANVTQDGGALPSVKGAGCEKALTLR